MEIRLNDILLVSIIPFLSTINPDSDLRVSPEKGNVAFASSDMGWCFTLRSFAQMYADTYGNRFQLP